MDDRRDFSGPIRSIGVLTSGGDAPGMNAAVRAVVRTAIAHGMTVWGIRRGYHGLLREELIPMNGRDVADIIQRGGTILQTARSKHMRTEEGQLQAAGVLKKYGIQGLVVIGGDGSFAGAQKLSNYGINVIGIPGTIDLDIACTDYTIGFDTAANTAMEAIDKIRDTSSSHERCSIVEVMGRDAGFLAQNSAIASGAEAAIIPEDSTDADQLEHFIGRGIRKSKNSSIVIVSESPKCGAMFYADRVKREYPQYDVRVSILGHLQRGGSPSARDRILASRLGSGAIDAILDGQRNVMIGVRNDKVTYVPFTDAIRSDKQMNLQLIKVLDQLSI
jgi:6-phosphofructokinase 1